jgi:hypothetical protein
LPCIAPSHQAPALLLKAWKPRLFSGLALVLGTVVPDLEFILRMDRDWIVSHTVAAQVYFTAPMVVLLYWLTVDLVLPWLLPYLPAGPPFYWRELATVSRLGERDRPRIALSGMVGGLTHVFLDGFTHGGREGWAVRWLPALRHPVPLPGGSMPLHDVLQLALTVVLGLAALHLWVWLVRAGKLREWRVGLPVAPVASASPGERRTLALILLSSAAAGAGLAPVLRGGPGFDLELAAYGGLTFLLLALLVGAGSDRLRRLRGGRGKPLAAGAGAWA